MNISDFTIYQKKDKIYSMGFEFNNILKKKGYPAMIGGSKNENYTNIKKLGLPVGLLLINNKNNNEIVKTKQFDGGFINNNLYNKLLFMAEQRKTTKSKTRKRRRKRKNKTKKY